MFIELSEFLRCPGDHEPTYLAVATGVMQGRDIVHGTIGCPVCEREFLIERSVARFSAPPEVSREAGETLPAPDDVPPALGITGPGGYVVLLGTAARFAGSLRERLEGVHGVGVNAPADVHPGPHLSLIEDGDRLPLRTAMARGVVVGAEFAGAPWLAEAARVLLRGRHLVVFRETLPASPTGVDPLASGRGMWVGAKR